jgi:transposase InsO family protein
MHEKRFFIKDSVEGSFTITELAERYGVSRKTAYKWIGRYVEDGFAGLDDRSRRPHTSPTRIDQAITSEVLKLRKRHPLWGPKKLLEVLHRRRSEVDWPARSTVADLLRRNDMIKSKRRRAFPGHPGRPTTPMTKPNDVWCADYKGQFRTRDGIYCYPLTVTDGRSRYLLGCQGLLTTAHVVTKPVFRRLFGEYGLPLIIRTDNGPPFATTALSRLSMLSVWWIRLGIYPELIEPGHPEQNGRHERMHRTLKAHTARPPAGNLSAQQRRFNLFRAEYNDERPHEALGMATPASIYVPSVLEYPSRLPELVYPDHYELRYVSANGGIRFNYQWVNVSHVLKGEYVGLEEVGDGVWDVYFGPVRLGWFDEQSYKLIDAMGRDNRITK